MDYYVALTGLPGCGKETFKDSLFAAARARGLGTFHISFTDVLRDECNAQDLECNRENYTNVANALRAAHGSDVLAERIVQKIHKIQAEETDSSKLFVLEAVRNPRESHLFRDKLGETYRLVAIAAPRDLLIERIRGRRRVDEQPGATDSRQVAEQLLDREFGVGQPPTGIRVGDCIEQADVRIENSGGLEALAQQAWNLLKEMVRSEFL